jgi:pimeloyl-ACP methyl ester carboxylesterase
MPRLSRQMKETIQTVLFLLVVVALVLVYVVYPLNRTKATMGRAGFGDYNADSLPPNDANAFVAASLTPDTFRVESDGLTTLACLYLSPKIDSAREIKGTVFLLHENGADRDAMLPLARRLLDSGFDVVAYDQRASGRSTGKYRGEGRYEANDLNEVIRYLDLRERIVHPVIVVGFSLGADAGILAAQDEKRIDGVVAINPYLSTTNLLDALRKQHNVFWFPFFRTIMWWWYNIRSSYAAPYRKTDDIEPVACRTLLLVSPASPASPEGVNKAEVQLLKELSPPELLEVKTIPDSEEELYGMIFQFATGVP